MCASRVFYRLGVRNKGTVSSIASSTSRFVVFDRLGAKPLGEIDARRYTDRAVRESIWVRSANPSVIVGSVAYQSRWSAAWLSAALSLKALIIRQNIFLLWPFCAVGTTFEAQLSRGGRAADRSSCRGTPRVPRGKKENRCQISARTHSVGRRGSANPRLLEFARCSCPP